MRYQVSSAPKLSNTIEKNEVFSSQVKPLLLLPQSRTNLQHKVCLMCSVLIQFNRPFSIRTLLFLTIMAFFVAAAPEELVKVAAELFAASFLH
jgi:hypothetical protein